MSAKWVRPVLDLAFTAIALATMAALGAPAWAVVAFGVVIWMTLPT